jgi:hypothetical protein
MSEDNTELARDLLRGADAIAHFIYGDPGYRRRIYHLASTSKLPVFKLGSMICARKSKLLEFIENQEK